MSFPNRPVRRSQLISPFGIGAMVNFPGGESLVPVVIDQWPDAMNPCPGDSGWKIRDERLEARLEVTHFRYPPDFREGGAGVLFGNRQVPCVRFPRWHYCHLCGGMEYVSLHEGKAPRCKGRPMKDRSCEALPEKRRPRLIPVRFVAVCENGHIEDFPFMEWCHWDGTAIRPITHQCRLRLRAGVSAASLAGIIIECVHCENAKRSMASAFRFSEARGGALQAMGLDCQGGEPWKGRKLPEWRGMEPLAHQTCGLPLRVVQRGGSSVYFPKVVSSLYLQKWAENVDPEIIELLDDPELWEQLTCGIEDGEVSMAACRALVGFRKLVGKIDPVALQKAAQNKLKPLPAGNTPQPKLTEADYRQAEYQALCEDQGDMNSDFYVKRQRLADYGANIESLFSKIHLVPKLRETRALEGFSRVNPSEGGPTLRPVRDNQSIDWLPATLVFGEGIFLELNCAALQVWETLAMRERTIHQELFARLNARRRIQGLQPRVLAPRFMLLHALAHALINQLSYDCGYGSASLRERLFVQSEVGKPAMHGLLIYTASGDSEGSMGGLVRQGLPGRFEVTLMRAIQRATWCSSDPVCLESHGQGSDNCNLAACHSCLLLPETSCEEGNRLLDRATLVGTHDKPEIGYFNLLL